MTSQAFAASANGFKGDPPTRMAVWLRLTGRQDATKPGRPWRPGPLLLSLLITNEKPRSLAIHISNSSVAGAMRLKCRAISRSSELQTAPEARPGAANLVAGFLPARGHWGHRPEAEIRRVAKLAVPAIATISRPCRRRLMGYCASPSTFKKRN